MRGWIHLTGKQLSMNAHQKKLLLAIVERYDGYEVKDDYFLDCTARRSTQLRRLMLSAINTSFLVRSLCICLLSPSRPCT